MIQALRIKQWCDKNLSPLAWSRLAMRLLPTFTKDKINLIKLDAHTVLDEKQFELVRKTLADLYKVSIEKSMFNN